MKKRERVIVFDGEDKFIIKKKHTYNSATGEMESTALRADRVAPVDSGLVELPPPTTVDNPPPRLPQVPIDDAPTPEPFQAPDWNSLDCEQIDNELAAIRNFLSTVRMAPEALAPYQNAIQDGERIRDSKCSRNPPALPDVPPPAPTPTPAPLPGVPLVNLGQPPRGGAGGGGGAAEKKPEEKKKSSVLLWILIAIGAAYLLSDKKN